MTDIETSVERWFTALNEVDAARRTELLAAAWAPDGRWVDPPFEGSGHAEISGMIDAIYQQYPEHRFRRAGDVDGHHDSVRVPWELVSPDGDVVLAGTDFGILGDDGRFARVTGFFG